MTEEQTTDTQDETLNASDLQSATDTTSEVDETSTEETTTSLSNDAQQALEARIKRMEAALKKANSEAKAHRLEAEDLKKYKDEQESAKLSDQERQEASRQKLEKQLADLQAEHNKVLDEAKAYRVNTEIKFQAARLGFADPEDAVSFIKQSDIEMDDNNSPTNITDLLSDLLKTKPYLKPQTQTRTASSGGATNPSRTQSSASGQLTWEAIGKMSQAEYLARRTEIMQWMAKNPIR